MNNLSIYAMALFSMSVGLTGCGAAKTAEAEPQQDTAIFESFSYNNSSLKKYS